MKSKFKSVIALILTLCVASVLVLPAAASRGELIVYMGDYPISTETTIFEYGQIYNSPDTFIKPNYDYEPLNSIVPTPAGKVIVGWKVWDFYMGTSLVEELPADGATNLFGGLTLVTPIFAEVPKSSNASFFTIFLLLAQRIRYFDGDEMVGWQKVNGGKILTPLTLEDKDGMTLEGWYTDKELTEKFDFSQPIKSGRKLYAKWIESPVEEGVPEETTEAEDTTETEESTVTE